MWCVEEDVCSAQVIMAAESTGFHSAFSLRQKNGCIRHDVVPVAEYTLPAFKIMEPAEYNIPLVQ